MFRSFFFFAIGCCCRAQGSANLFFKSSCGRVVAKGINEVPILTDQDIPWNRGDLISFQKSRISCIDVDARQPLIFMEVGFPVVFIGIDGEVNNRKLLIGVECLLKLMGECLFRIAV